MSRDLTKYSFTRESIQEYEYKVIGYRVKTWNSRYKTESINEEYSNKFEDLKESFDFTIEDNMSNFVSGF